ncbi:MAG: hypothetical protein IKK53_02185 [Ruminiclostridium sp.]|nr:hypothetical protein [Ruminiclostridium sp.]
MERRIRADKRTQEALEAAGDTEGAIYFLLENLIEVLTLIFIRNIIY